MARHRIKRAKISVVRLLQFPSLSNTRHFRHAITTRAGGFSVGDFASLNLAFHVGDDVETVRRNRRALAAELGYDAEKLVCAQQVHGAHCAAVNSSHAGHGALDWASALPATDAIVTAQTDLPLLILVADCAPITLVDPKSHIFAVVHAGWRGALGGVAAGAVAKMETLGARAMDIRAAIGPCLCARNLEVGAEVAEMFEDKIVIKANGEKYLLDLRALVRRDLESVGVNQIETLDICPKDEDDFFSHRGQNGRAGRFGIVAWWES